MPQVKMNVSTIGGVIQTQFSGTVVTAADGTVTVDARDVPSLLAAGGVYVNTTTRFQTISPAPRAGSAGRVVASVALANGTLTIANQPDIPRRLNLRVDPGTVAISAGVGTLIYTANDGTSQTDAFSLVTGSAALLTNTTTKGVVKLTSAVVTALAGGASPLTQIDDTNSLSMLVDPSYQNFTVLKENTDGADATIGTVATSAASVVPTTAPNATHTYGYVYSYTSPDI